jgi:hypothetical protein
MKNSLVIALLSFIIMLYSVASSVACEPFEKETPAQFRARYKAHIRKLGILKDVDIRTLSNDDLKNTVLEHMESIRNEALTLGIEKNRCSHTDILELQEEIEQIKARKTNESATVECSTPSLKGHKMTSEIAKRKKEQTQAIRDEALKLGIEKGRCTHMEISELQKEIEQAKALKEKALRLGIDKNTCMNADMHELQRAILQREEEPYPLFLAKKTKGQARGSKK